MKPPFFSRYGLVILMTVAFLMPFMYVGALRSLRSNKNDVKSWLPEAYEETATYRWYRQHFESDMFILASWEGCTLDSPALELLAKKLVPPADSQQNPLTAPLPFFKRAITGTELVKLLVTGQGFTEEEAIERLKGFVVGPDGRQTCLILTVAQESEEAWEAQRAASGYRKPKFLHAVVERVYEVAEQQCAIPRSSIRLAFLDEEAAASFIPLAFSARINRKPSSKAVNSPRSISSTIICCLRSHSSCVRLPSGSGIPKYSSNAAAPSCLGLPDTTC